MFSTIFELICQMSYCYIIHLIDKVNNVLFKSMVEFTIYCQDSNFSYIKNS